MAGRHKRIDPATELEKAGRKDAPPQMVMPTDPEGLPKLTEQQFAYVWHRCQGLRQVEAYREAYDTNAAPPSQYVEASYVERAPNVAMWLDECRRQGLVDQRTTREQHSAMLAYIRNRALDAGKYSAATTAEYYRGRAERLYVDIVEVREGELDIAKFLKQIEFLLGADQAMIAAGKLGVEYKPKAKKLVQSTG